MSIYASLLKSGAEEVCKFAASSQNANQCEAAWFESLAVRMETASLVVEPESQNKVIKAIAYSIIDSGPMDSELSLSFFKAMELSQRKSKKQRVGRLAGWIDT